MCDGNFREGEVKEEELNGESVEAGVSEERKGHAGAKY